MRPIAFIVAGLAVASLCACGQKGPLVRPGTHAPARPVVSPPAAPAPEAAPDSASAASAAR